MKKIVLAYFLFFNVINIFAQKELPAFGKIDKADLTMTECEFDKDAVAYKLVDYGDVRYIGSNNTFKIQMDIRERIKILKDKGLQYANVKIHFYSRMNYEDITGIQAITYNLDNGNNVVTTKVDKSSIYIKAINERYSEVSFTLPDVKVGSVIEYKYTDTKVSYSNMPDWVFQDYIPVRLSMYRILVPELFKFVTQTLTYQKVEQKNDQVHENVFISGRMISYNSDEKTYILRQVPALKDEPYMSAAKDYLQRIVFQLSAIDYGNGRIDEVMSTWPGLTKELLDDEDFGLQLRKNIPHTRGLDDSLKLVNSDYGKMVMIYNYVRNNMNWNESEYIYTTSGIKSAWDKKSGNNSEINFILINLLRDAGLKAYPLLVSTKDNGIVNTLYPFLDQFNNTMAYVLINDKKYILDASDKYNPAYLIPYDVVNNEAFIVDNEKGGWIVLEDDKDIFRNTVSIFSEITPDGVMSGDATIYSAGYCKNPKVKKWKENKSSFDDYFSKSYTGMKIKDIEVENEDVDTMPLQQKVKFSLPLSSSGDYEYFSVNLFQGLEKNPFIADERVTDIDFGYKQSYMIVGKIFIPDGYEFDELPKNVKMIMPDTSIVMTRIMQADNNSIDLRLTVDFERPFYAASSYPEFHEFYKKLFATLNEQVVIKKKKS